MSSIAELQPPEKKEKPHPEVLGTLMLAKRYMDFSVTSDKEMVKRALVTRAEKYPAQVREVWLNPQKHGMKIPPGFSEDDFGKQFVAWVGGSPLPHVAVPVQLASVSTMLSEFGFDWFAGQPRDRRAQILDGWRGLTEQAAGVLFAFLKEKVQKRERLPDVEWQTYCQIRNERKRKAAARRAEGLRGMPQPEVPHKVEAKPPEPPRETKAPEVPHKVAAKQPEAPKETKPPGAPPKMETKQPETPREKATLEPQPKAETKQDIASRTEQPKAGVPQPEAPAVSATLWEQFLESASRQIRKGGLEWLREQAPNSKKAIYSNWGKLSHRAASRLLKDFESTKALDAFEKQVFSEMKAKIRQDAETMEVDFERVSNNIVIYGFDWFRRRPMILRMKILGNCEKLSKSARNRILERFEKEKNENYTKNWTRHRITEEEWAIYPKLLELKKKEDAAEKRGNAVPTPDIPVGRTAQTGTPKPSVAASVDREKLFLEMIAGRKSVAEISAELKLNEIELGKLALKLAGEGKLRPAGVTENVDAEKLRKPVAGQVSISDGKMLKEAHKALEKPYRKPTIDELVDETGWKRKKVLAIKGALGLETCDLRTAKARDRIVEAVGKNGGKVPNKVMLKKLTGLSRFQVDGQLPHLMKAGVFPEAKAATFELEKATITDDPYKLAARLMISQLAPTGCRYFLLKHLAEDGKSAYEIAKTTGASSGSLHLEQKHLMDTGLVLQDGERYAVTKRGKKVLKATEKIFFQGHPPSKLGKKKDWSLTKIFSNAAHSGICAAFLDLADMQESVPERGWVTHGQSGEAELYLHDSASFYKLAKMGLVWEEDVGKSGRFAYSFGEDFAKLKRIPFGEIARKCPFKQHYSSEDRQAADKLLQKHGIPLSVRETVDSPSKLLVSWCIASGMFTHNAIARKTGMRRTDVTMVAGMFEDAGHVRKRLPGIRINVEEKRARMLLDYLRRLEGIAAGELKERRIKVKVPETGMRDKFVSLPLPPPIEAEEKSGTSRGKRAQKRKETNPDRLKKAYEKLKTPRRNPTADELAKELGWSVENVRAAKKGTNLEFCDPRIAETMDKIQKATDENGGVVPPYYVLEKKTGLSKFRLKQYVNVPEPEELEVRKLGWKNAEVVNDAYRLAARRMVSYLIPADYRYFLLRAIISGESTPSKIISEISGSAGDFYEGLRHLKNAGLVAMRDGGYFATKRGRKVLNATDAIFFEGKPPASFNRKRKWDLTDVFGWTRHAESCAAFLHLADMQDSVKGEREWISFGAGGKIELPVLIKTFQRFMEMNVIETERAEALYRAYEFSAAFKKIGEIPFKEIAKVGTLKLKYSKREKAEVAAFLAEHNIPPGGDAGIDCPSRLRVAWCIANKIFNCQAIGERTGLSMNTALSIERYFRLNGSIQQRQHGIRINMEEPRAVIITNYLRELERIVADELKENGFKAKLPAKLWGKALKTTPIPLPLPIEASDLKVPRAVGRGKPRTGAGERATGRKEAVGRKPKKPPVGERGSELGGEPGKPPVKERGSAAGRLPNKPPLKELGGAADEELDEQPDGMPGEGVGGEQAQSPHTLLIATLQDDAENEVDFFIKLVKKMEVTQLTKPEREEALALIAGMDEKTARELVLKAPDLYTRLILLTPSVRKFAPPPPPPPQPVPVEIPSALTRNVSAKTQEKVDDFKALAGRLGEIDRERTALIQSKKTDKDTVGALALLDEEREEAIRKIKKMDNDTNDALARQAVRAHMQLIVYAENWEGKKKERFETAREAARNMLKAGEREKETLFKYMGALEESDFIFDGSNFRFLEKERPEDGRLIAQALLVFRQNYRSLVEEFRNWKRHNQ